MKMKGKCGDCKFWKKFIEPGNYGNCVISNGEPSKNITWVSFSCYKFEHNQKTKLDHSGK
jgi:hypothetical protein